MIPAVTASLGGPGPMERALDRAAGSRVIGGNAIRHVPHGPTAFDLMRAAIAEARECVHFENYIIRDDATGQSFADLLMAAARRGAAIRVLYDVVGCRGTSRTYWRRLRGAGVEVRGFNPPRLSHPERWVRRDHRKYLAVDGRRAVVGGLCIGDEWAGDTARQRRPWRDTAVEVQGPAVPALEASFATLWALAGPPLPAGAIRTQAEPRGPARVRVIRGAPRQLRTYRTVELLATGAAERLWITEAYLLPPQAIYASLVAAARDNVDVRLLLPGRSDIPAVSVFARVGYRELLSSGIRIWEWRGPMLHAKTVVVDGALFKIGSSNLNAASLNTNYELDLLIEDDAIAHAAMTQFRQDLTRAVEVVFRAPRWAPGALAQRMPPTVGAGAPPAGVDHRPSAVERSRRAVVTLRSVAAGARRSIAGATIFGMLGAGLLLVALPRLIGYALAFICFWLAGSAAWRYLGRRQERDD